MLGNQSGGTRLCTIILVGVMLLLVLRSVTPQRKITDADRFVDEETIQRM